MIRAFARTLAALVVASVPLLSDTRLPVFFEPSGDYFLARSGGHAVHISAQTAFIGGTRMTLVGAARQAAEPREPLPSYSNYILGDQRRTRVPHYSRVYFRNVYPDIDLVYYSREGALEYDFVIRPGGDPGRIRLAFQGGATPDQGGLRLRGGARLRKPVAFQGETPVTADFRLRGDGTVAFELGRYDRSRTLTIDPVIEFSRYFGGRGRELGVAVALDSTGNPVVAGVTTSDNLPTRRESAQEIFGGATDAFVAKFSRFDGSLQWVTFLGGKGTETNGAIAIDRAGNIYVSGDTTSADFPVRNAAQPVFGGGACDAYVAKLNSAGTALVYSTFIGGGSEDFGNSVAVDGAGNAFTTGWTTSATFPVRNAFQSTPTGGGADVFVTKIAPSGSSFVYSTYIGGSGQDLATGIAVDSAGAAYVTGMTTSSVLALANGAQRRLAGEGDAFVFKLAPAGNGLIYGTYLGGSGNETGYRIAVDGAGSAIVSGYTQSANFPVSNAYQSANRGGADVFVTKLSPTGGEFLFSTYVGGSRDDYGLGSMALDASGTIYVAGYTASPDFPQRNGVQGAYGGGAFDGFVFRLSPSGNALLYSTWIGGRGEDRANGIALDERASPVVAGGTSSPDFPAAANELEPGLGEFDVFVSKLSSEGAVNAVNANPPVLDLSGTRTQMLRLDGPVMPLGFSVSSTPDWITVSPLQGMTPAELKFSVNAGQPPGNYSGTVLIDIPGAFNSPLVVPVRASIAAVPVIRSVDPANAVAGAAEARITISGANFLPDSIVLVNDSPTPTSYLNASTLQAVIPGVQLGVPSMLTITVLNPGATSNAIGLTVAGEGPSVHSVVSGATFAAGPVAPGQVVTVYGSGFGGPDIALSSFSSGQFQTVVGETRLLIDDEAAPLIYVGQGQLSGFIPYTVAGRSTARLEVEFRGRRSSPVSLTIVQAAPGIFVSHDTEAAALNEDGSLNRESNPAARVSWITISATGEGITAPLITAGQILSSPTVPVLGIKMFIGGVEAELDSAGGVPGQAAGIMRIRARIPAEAAAGRVPLVLRVGEMDSPAVTVFVE